jgi:hypothetical protein
MIWLFGVNDHMSPLETVDWLFEMLFWFAVTPLIIYFANYFRFRATSGYFN